MELHIQEKINITDLTGVSSSDDILGDTTVRRVSGGGRISINTTEVPLKTDNLSYFAATTSDELRGVISDETGTGSLVFATSPTLVTPALGTPASGVLTNCTGTASGLTAGTASVATTVTITDNESTNEDNAIIFAAGGDVDGEIWD